MREKPRDYMINAWANSMSYGTSCIMRTSDKQLWLDKIREIVKEKNVQRSACRVVVHNGLTVWSYCTSGEGHSAFTETVFWNKPLQLKMGWPKEVDE